MPLIPLQYGGSVKVFEYETGHLRAGSRARRTPFHPAPACLTFGHFATFGRPPRMPGKRGEGGAGQPPPNFPAGKNLLLVASRGAAAAFQQCTIRCKTSGRTVLCLCGIYPRFLLHPPRRFRTGPFSGRTVLVFPVHLQVAWQVSVENNPSKCGIPG